MVKHGVLLAVLAACASNNQNLEVKIENLTNQVAKTQRELEELRQLYEARMVAPQPGDDPKLAQKVDELSRKIDQLATRNLGPARPARPTHVEPDKSKVYAVPVDGYPAQGPRDAKVTLIVAHDYACPFCAKNRATLDDLRKKYGADLRIVYRNLISHPQTATAAALASCAATRQGKFEDFEFILYEQAFKAGALEIHKPDTPDCWNTGAGCPLMLGFARDAKLKLDRFKVDMAACESQVKSDMAELGTFGVLATPSFFINGRFVLGAMPIEAFSTLIDEELAKANERIKAGTPKARYYQTWVIGKGLTKVEQPPTPIAN